MPESQARAPGRPREYDREALALALARYIDATKIPILAEFAYLHEVTRELLYEWNEPFPTLVKRCVLKKESALERGMLDEEINVTGAIFSLKQLGWKDRVEHSGDKNAPVALHLSGSDVRG